MILEDDNPHDPNNAVRVEIEGEIVGYLAKHNARRYRKGLEKLNLTDVIGVCGAAVFGKKEYDFEDMRFGVWLDLDLKELVVEKERPKQSAPVSNPAPVASLPQVAKAAPSHMPSKSKPALSPKPAKKRSARNQLIGAIIIICLVFSCVAFAVDQVQLVLEGSGILPTRTPRPTATEYISFSTAYVLTNSARPTPTPKP